MTIPDLMPHAVAAKYAILVDVGYLYAAAGEVLLGAKERKEYRVAAEELIQSLQKHALQPLSGELLRLYWFDAARDRVPTVDQRVIAKMPCVKVRLGNLNSRGQQKGVDAQIRSDLEPLARHHAVPDAIFLAGDEDMVPAVEAAQAYGVRVHFWGVEPPYGTNQAERLVWESDTVAMIDAEYLGAYFSRAPQPVPVAPPVTASVARAGVRRARARQTAQSSPARWPSSGPSRAACRGGRRARGPEVDPHAWPRQHPRPAARPDPAHGHRHRSSSSRREKELGHSLRPYPEARVWLRDGFWARVYREFEIKGVGVSSK